MVEDIVALLKDNSFLSEHGKLGANKHLNAIWVEDDAARIIKIKKLIQEIDKPMKQVLITARIANVDDSFSRELGFKFGTRPSQEKKSEPESDLTMDLPNFNIKSGHFNAAIATVAQNNLLDLQLSALETEGRGKILSSPQLLTANRQAAYIEAGEEIPYQEQAGNGATNVSFKKAVLSLKVTPTITPNNKILLDLVVNQDKLSPITVNGIPAIQTRELRTQVMVENGATIILGGIYETLKNETIERIPVLGSLPLLGNFFKHKQSKIEQRELIVFVTPKVMD
jgi:type IV pilus assembly protein PilQ